MSYKEEKINANKSRKQWERAINKAKRESEAKKGLANKNKAKRKKDNSKTEN